MTGPLERMITHLNRVSHFDFPAGSNENGPATPIRFVFSMRGEIVSGCLSICLVLYGRIVMVVWRRDKRVINFIKIL